MPDSVTDKKFLKITYKSELRLYSKFYFVQ